MLSEPKYGWTVVNIGDFNERASYLTDIPIDILNNACSLINGSNCCEIYFDAEGFDYIVEYKEGILRVIEETDFNIKEEKVCVSKSLYSFISEIYIDITLYLDGWLNWMNMIEEDKETNWYKKRKKEILKRLKEIELFLEKNKKGC